MIVTPNAHKNMHLCILCVYIAIDDYLWYSFTVRYSYYDFTYGIFINKFSGIHSNIQKIPYSRIVSFHNSIGTAI